MRAELSLGISCLWAIVLFCGTATAGQPKPASLTPLQQRWTNYCVSFCAGFFHYDGPSNAKFAPTAKRKFCAMSRSELKQRLEPCQFKLRKLTSWFSAGNQDDWEHGEERNKIYSEESYIAYTLAYFGVNVRENVHRLGGFAEYEHSMRLNIYYKRPSDWLFRDIVTGIGDGAGTEVLRTVRCELFRKFPEKVLLFCSQDRNTQVINELATDLVERENLTTAAILRRETHSHNRRVARAARYCLKFYRENSYHNP